MDHLEYFIHFFGYAKSDTENNKFGFYDYKGKASQKSLDDFDKFKDLNLKMLDKRCAQKASGNFAAMPINRGKEGIDMLNSKKFVEFG